MSRSVATISDTVLGYGSPQVLSLTKGLGELIGGDHQIFQPFVPHRKFIDLTSEGYSIETIATIEHPWTLIGRTQYLRQVSNSINQNRPDIIVLPNYNMIPLIGLLNYRPKRIIHLALEDMDQFGDSYLGRSIVRNIKRYIREIDIWIFPERNRAIHDCKVLEIPFDKTCILYNVLPLGRQDNTEIKLNNRIIYAGSVDFDRTAALFFDEPKIASFPIDVFGGLSGSSDKKNQFLSAANSSPNGLRYFGEIPAVKLDQKLSSYSYSLVYWMPKTWALRNAAPNKFFQAISSGVPVISAPHPQCVELIERYGCGVALKDWEFNTFMSGIDHAIKKIGTSYHQEMIEGCKRAYRDELNWGMQFTKVAEMLGRV